MEELVWNNNSSMLPTVSTPSPWDYGTVISFQVPASCSAPVPSIPDLPCGNVDDSSILGIQQQPDISYSPLQSNAIANKHPHLQVKKIPGQMIPSLLDKIAADSVLTRSISVTGWGHASPTEIPASSFSAATNMPVFQSKSEINQNFLDHTIACLQQSGSSSCNDLMKFSYSYDDSQMRYLQSCIESLDCVLFSENSIEKDDGMSPTSTTQKNMTGNKKSKVLSASIPSNNIIEDYQFASQSTSNSITMKSKAMKSKSKTKTCKDDPQLGLQYNYSASTSSSSCLIFDNVNPAGIEPDAEAIASMKEMVYRAAVFRPVNLGTEVLEKPKRKNVRISSHPQTVAARQRRERINDRLRILQRLVPGGTKMDTASMLEEAVNYLKFLKTQVKVLQSMANNKVDNNMQINSMAGFCSAGSSLNSFTSLSSALNSHIYQNRLL